MKNLNKYITVVLVLIFVGSCETYKLPEIAKPSAGTSGLDFSKMVSVGNSLTAGFMNGALYTAGQTNSYPAIIAAQMAQAGGGSFNQPDIGSVNGFFGVAGSTVLGRLRLKIVNGSPSPTPQLPGDIPSPFAGDKSKLNNFGVPGVTLLTAQIPALGGPPNPPGVVPPPNPAFNALYQRFASNPSTNGTTGSTLIGDAAAALNAGGTFFTFWLGNNDVLGYATGGASNPAILTSQVDFKTRLASALAPLLAANSGTAEGAVANIPNVTNIPFFTTVTVNPVNLPAANAAGLNAGFAGYNSTLDAFKGAPFNLPAAEMDARKINFVTGLNRLVIADETVRDLGPLWDGLVGAGALTTTQRAQLEPYRFARQAIISTPNVTGDLVVLTASSFIGTLVGGNPQLINGLTIPLADNWVLIPSERTQIQNAIDGFNASISEIVATNSSRLVLVDTNAALKALTPPPGGAALTINGSTITASIFPPFGAFSLDGVHPNARGAGYIANLFIQAINAKWGSSIPLCNPNNYPGNELPSL
jgi:hypothetical protein